MDDDHPPIDTGKLLENLAGRFSSDYQGARPYYKRALAIFTASLGDDHPYTRTVEDSGPASGQALRLHIRLVTFHSSRFTLLIRPLPVSPLQHCVSCIISPMRQIEAPVAAETIEMVITDVNKLWRGERLAAMEV